MPVNLSSPDMPLYNHPLPEIEGWLISIGCQQDAKHPHCWQFARETWKAEIQLEVEELAVHYNAPGQQDTYRSFKYSLSRQDIENAIVAGP
jgi:Protein of unknown function (DUF3143)